MTWLEELGADGGPSLASLGILASETNVQLNELYSRVGRLQRQAEESLIDQSRQEVAYLRDELNKLKQLIDPETADQFLAVANMNREILARGKFEEQVKTDVEKARGEIANIRSEVLDTYRWMLGAAVALLGAIWASTLRVIKTLGAVRLESRPIAERDPG